MNPRHAAAALRRDDQGQLLLLVLGYVVIAALLLSVVVNVSKVYLDRRALLAAADGAALAAASRPDLTRVYTSPATPGPLVLPVDAHAAAAAVEDYLAQAQLDHRFSDLTIVSVHVNRDQVSVTLAASVHMPLLNLISASHADGYPVHATATARTLTP